MSSVSPMRIRTAENPRFPSQHCLAEGESAPKVSPVNAGVANGRAVEIRLHMKYRYGTARC
jgi:hypothetical protein